MVAYKKCIKEVQGIFLYNVKPLWVSLLFLTPCSSSKQVVAKTGFSLQLMFLMALQSAILTIMIMKSMALFTYFRSNFYTANKLLRKSEKKYKTV